MAQSIPDGTPCMVVKALPEYSHYLGRVVVTCYEPWVSTLLRRNLYRVSPVLPDVNGRPLFGTDDCLMPIPPKEDDTQQESTSELNAANV